MTIASDPAAHRLQAWVTRYLALLGVAQDAPSLPALAALTRAHLHVVPFENLTSLRRRAAQPEGPVPPLDPDALLGNWEVGRGGGVCYELATMIGRLLEALGYRAWLILGQISFPGSHQAILVELAGDRYLVDIGCGAPLFAPIPLDQIVVVRRAGLAYRFRPAKAAAGWVQERWLDGAWTPFCHYDLRPPREREQEAAYQRHHTPGQSWVVDRPRLIRCEDDMVFKLTDAELVCFTVHGKHTERVQTPEQFRRLVAEVFQLPALPFADVRR